MVKTNTLGRRTSWWRAGIVFGLLAVMAVSEPLVWAKSSKSGKSSSAALALGEDAAVEEAKNAGSKNPNLRRVTLSLKQLGAWSSIKLRGVDGNQTLAFPIRADEVVVGATLRIGYDYSPSLLADLSHLKILLNDRIVAVERLPKDKGVGNERDIALDPRMFRDNNTLQFKLVGHYTPQCEDPFHSSLWLTLSDLGRLELTLAPLGTGSDLRKLPLPFFDTRENTNLSVPFVFAKAPSQGTLQAAGVVASWFGMQAKNRGVQFPVSLNTLPEGNAVVFLQNGESVEGVKALGNATVALVPHPNNALAKLLLVTGSNDAELGRAARAIALASHTLAGQSMTVTKEVDSAPRKPYDAPAWVPTDRPVRLGELMAADQMRVRTYYPDAIRVNYRVPPDLFTWHSPGIPLDLKYRATLLPYHHNSSLNIGLNGNFLQTLALNSESARAAVDDAQSGAAKYDGNGVRQEKILLPPHASTGRDQLQFAYYFDVIKNGRCGELPPDNLEGAIDPESTIDFSKFPHFVALPNLAYFANMGYPFTRLADLSETAVVLPEAPSAPELGLYLTVMARMGEATGYPALRFALTSPAAVEKMAARDLIVITSANNQSLMTKWKAMLPMVVVDGERQVREATARWYPTYRWAQDDVRSPPNPPGSLNFAGNTSLAVIMGFESPLQSSRSVVFFYADKSADLRKIADVLSDTERMASVQGDLVVVDDKQVSHVKAADTYYWGDVPIWYKLRWYLGDQPLVFGLLTLLVCVVLAVLAYRPLRRMLDKRAKTN